MKENRRRIGLAVGALLLLLSFGQAQEKSNQPKQQGINWPGIPLYDVTMWVHKETGKKFLFADERLKTSKIYFISDKPIDKPEDKFAVYQSLLQISGYALVKVGEGDTELYKIIPLEKMKGNPPEYRTGAEQIRPEDRFITRVFKLENVKPSEVQQTLVNLVREPGALQSIEPAGMILVTDYDYNVERIAKIVQAIDVKHPDILMKMIPLKNSLATETGRILNELVQAIIQRSVAPGGGPQAKAQEQVKIMSDTRTNSVIVLAEPDRIKQIEQLVKDLDGEAGFETSGVFIYRLKYSDVGSMADIISKIFRPSATPTAGAPAAGPAGAGVGAPPGMPPPTIVADQTTNSILVVTDRNTYKAVEQLISKLDQRKRQVLIRVSVIEVRSTDTFDLGAELGYAFQMQGGQSIANTAFSLSTVDASGNKTPIFSPGALLAVSQNGIPGNLPVILEALKHKATIRTLSEPEALANDNEQAKFEIKNQVPYQTTMFVGPTQTPTTNFQFADAATTLTISPHISEGQTIRLNINVDIQSFGQPPAIGALPPKTGKNLIATITVPNARTVVLGGLTTHDDTLQDDRVPLLGDIPIIGFAFGHKHNALNKSTLYVFVTPYVIYDEKFGDLRDATRERKGILERLQEEPLNRLDVDPKCEVKPKTLYQPQIPDEPPKAK